MEFRWDLSFLEHTEGIAEPVSNSNSKADLQKGTKATKEQRRGLPTMAGWKLSLRRVSIGKGVRAGLAPAPTRCGTESIDAMQPILAEERGAEEWGAGVLILNSSASIPLPFPFSRA